MIDYTYSAVRDSNPRLTARWSDVINEDFEDEWNVKAALLDLYKIEIV